MQSILTRLAPYLPILGYWLLATGIANVLARRSQIDAWCEARPKLAGVQKILRGMGFDPFLILQGFSLLLTGKLPANLRKFIPIFLVVPFLVGCNHPAPVTPTAYDAAVAAVNITDVALAAAISAAAPVPDKDVPTWQARLEALESAADVLRAKGDVCSAMPVIASVAVQIGCSQCVSVVMAAERELSCSP